MSDDDITELTFVPNAGIGVSITTFMNALRPEENTSLLPSEATREVGGEAVKDLTNASLESGFAIYEGTEVSIKRQFALENDGNPIFKKPYDGSSSEIVDLTNNTLTFQIISLPQGKKLIIHPVLEHLLVLALHHLVCQNLSLLSRKVKTKFKLLLLQKMHLKQIALPIGLSTVGIGTTHTFTAIDANQKVLVAIDNAIQSPIAGTSVTTTLRKNKHR